MSWTCPYCSTANEDGFSACTVCGRERRKTPRKSEAATWVCPECGTSNADIALYCTECGFSRKQKQSPEKETLVCPICGRELQPFEQECPVCKRNSLNPSRRKVRVPYVIAGVVLCLLVCLSFWLFLRHRRAEDTAAPPEEPPAAILDEEASALIYHDEPLLVTLESYYDDALSEIIRYTYRSDGQPDTKQICDPAGDVELTEYYRYDDQGRLVQVDSCLTDREVLYYRQFSYDTNNRVVKETGYSVFDGDGTPSYELRYEYDGDRLISETTYSTISGERYGWELYHYDESGRLISKDNYIIDETVVTTTRYYYDESGRLMRECSEPESNTGATINDTTLKETISYTYNDNGLLLEKITVLEPDYIPPRREKYYYQ